MKRYFKLLFILCVCSVFASCSKDDEKTERSGFVISLGEAAVDVTSRATPKELGKPLDANFRIKVVNVTTGSSVYDGEFTQFIPVNTGSYELTASYGENAELEFDTPYYIGTATAEHQESVNTPVTIPCKVGNALLSVVFENADEFNKLYSKYGLRVDVGESSKTIGGDETAKSLYFKAGSDVKIYFDATKKDNSPYSVDLTAGLSSVLPFKAADHAVVKLSASAFGLKIEKIEVEKVTVSETIPVEWLPKPKVSGFEDITYVETDDAPQNAVIDYTASLPIQDMELTLNMQDEQYSAYNKTYTLSTLTSDDRANLGKLGIELPEVGVAKTGTINLQNLIGTMQTNAGTMVDNTFSLRVKANNRWSDEAATAKTYKVEVVKPEFSVSVYPGNIWTKEFTVNAVEKDSVKRGKADVLNQNMIYQYSVNKTDWVTLSDKMTQKNLSAGTKYYVRGLYRGKVLSDNTQEIRTYESIQIPNSTLDDGYDTSNPKKKNPLYKFKGGWIDTRNNLTCHANGVNAFYVSKSGTLPEKGNNSTVAHMMTIGWGEGNTCSFGSKSSSVIKNVSAGIVCVGDFDVSTKVINPKSAYIRPTSMEFTYKASPYNGDEYLIKVELLNVSDDVETVVGSGVLQSGASVGNYTTSKVGIKYDDRYNNLAISHVRILFQSGIKEDTDHLEDSFRDASVWNGYTTAYIMGSQLWLDSFTLKYDR